jgi:mannose-6-phosphate isomerase-like protein (cupin superfamily)
MRFIPSDAQSFIPASHENPLSPGVLKKILLTKADLQPGRVQMINWARQAPGKRFSRHYHEDMQEIFVFLGGHAELTVDGKTLTMRRGDAVVIDPREIHEMRNHGPEQVEYVVVGITAETGGKTVVVEKP